MKDATKLTHVQDIKVLAEFTDASEEFREGVVTKYDRTEEVKDIYEQKQEPIAFFGGQSTGAQKIWTMYENESYVIVKVFDRMNHVIWGPSPCTYLPTTVLIYI